jgi:hypothetical protein
VRDEPALVLVINILLTTLPAAVLQLRYNNSSHVLGAAYVITNYVLYLQRFMLTLHVTEHRRLFRSSSNGDSSGPCSGRGSMVGERNGVWVGAASWGRGWRMAGWCGQALNALLVPGLLCLLFGVPPGLYRAHHVVMHHVVRAAPGRTSRCQFL